MKKERENFGSRAAVIMALAGSAIGLGNIWRFPYMVGEYGGAAFVLVYILCSVFLSIPIFVAESVIGRRSRANCRGAMEKLAPGSKWKVLGYLTVLTPMIIVSYYSVVGGWSLDFLYKSLRLAFIHSDSAQIGGMFGSFISRTWSPIISHTVFMLVSSLIVACGVKRGIENFSKFSIPVLFVLIVVILVYSVTLPGSGEGVRYLISPDFSKLTAKTCTYALGQSFYSLSLGMGIVITYSSYVSKKENLLVSAGGTAGADLLFALLSGFAIMPAVFAAGIQPSAGPGLLFQTLPHIFAKMGLEAPVLSSAAAILFFLAIVVAALTSSVSLIEVGVAYLVEEKKMNRLAACGLVFVGTWALGVLCSLSFGPLKDLLLFGHPLFDFLDALSSNVLLTVGALLVVIFVGWKMKREDVRDEFTSGGLFRANERFFPAIYFIIRYLAPIAVAVIFISNFIS